jgi:hypothetical protein
VLNVYLFVTPLSSLRLVLKCSIISHSNVKMFGDNSRMKTRFLLLISITTSFVLSLVVTLVSYFYSTEPFIVDARILYRGWPLYWMTESWSYWSPPPYPHRISFQPVNFLIDFVFYAIIFQIPMQLYLYSKEARKPQVKT